MTTPPATSAPRFTFPPDDLLRNVLATINSLGWHIFDVECTAGVGLNIEPAAITARFTQQPRVHALRIVERTTEQQRFKVTLFPHRLAGVDLLSPVSVEEMEDGMLSSSRRAKAIETSILRYLQHVHSPHGDTP